MSKKAVSVIKHSIVAIFLAIAICAIFLFFILLDFDTSLIYTLCGDVFANFYYYILPLAAFLVPITIKRIKKINLCNFYIPHFFLSSFIF